MTPSRADGDVLFVGSLQYQTVEEALRDVGKVGDAAPCLPDGEVGDRYTWTAFLEFAFDATPDVETSREPVNDDALISRPDQHEDLATIEAWTKTYKVKEGVSSFRFAPLGYAKEAINSYRVFTALRDEGAIAQGVRFQVSIPSTVSGADSYFDQPSQWPIVHEAFADAVKREIEEIAAVVPPSDLAIQFDLAWEVVDLSVGDGNYIPFWPASTYEEKLRRHAELLGELTPLVPDEALLGLHLCYGTWGGWPMTDMVDMRLCIEFSNALAASSQRLVDYIHMPAAKDPSPEFFAPLADLAIDDAKVYLGLIHASDGIEGFRRRVELASAVLDDFGVATVCGMARDDPQELEGVIDLHCDAVKVLREMRAG